MGTLTSTLTIATDPLEQIADLKILYAEALSAYQKTLQGGNESYSIDTGQTKQSAKKLPSTLDEIMKLAETIRCLELQAGVRIGTIQVRPEI